MNDETLQRLQEMSLQLPSLAERVDRNRPREVTSPDVQVMTDFSEHFADEDLLVAALGNFSVAAVETADLVSHLADAPVSQQLATWLLVLDDPRSRSDCERSDLAQAALGEILLRYPVLLHPRLQIRHGDTRDEKVMSVLHAISQVRGRLPLPDDPGVGMDRYHKFISNASVWLGLDCRSLQFSNTSQLARGYRPVEACMVDELSKPRHWFIYSAHQVLAESGAGPSDKARLFGGMLHSYGGCLSEKQLDAWVMHFIGAAGLNGEDVCPGFLALMAQQSPDVREVVLVHAFFADQCHKVLFAPEESTLPLAERFDRLASGMALAGLSDSVSAAVETMWRANRMAITKPELAQAFIHVIAATGLDLSSPASYPKSAALVQALEIYITETRMNAVIDSHASVGSDEVASGAVRRRAPRGV